MINKTENESYPPSLVSVIIPCFNAGETVAETIISVLKNARPEINLEIIAVDDCSSDETLGVLNRFNNKLKIISLKHNAGVSNARNIGIDAANGNFIAFCDADDIWEDDKLAQQIPLFNDPEVGLVCSSGLIFQDGKVIPEKQLNSYAYKRGGGYFDLLQKNFIVTSSTVVRSEVLKKMKFNSNIRHSEDFDLWLRISKEWKVGFVEKKLIKYRISDNQASKNWKAMHESRIRIINDHLKNVTSKKLRRKILAGAAYGYAMEFWDIRDFRGGRTWFLKSLRNDMGNFGAWARFFATLVPKFITIKLLSLKNKS